MTKGQRGFSLIEMLAVVFVVVLLTTASISMRLNPPCPLLTRQAPK